MDYLDKFVPDVTFEKIPIRNLVSNQEYQRSLSMVHVDKAVDNFDIFQINPVNRIYTSIRKRSIRHSGKKRSGKIINECRFSC